MIRLNKHKKEILNVLRSVTSHPTADWIYDKVREKIPNISLGTIYRNLNFLTKNSLILKLDYSGQMSRFDGNPQTHAHIACTKCGKVADIDITLDSKTINNASTLSLYEIKDYRLEFYGHCTTCK